jgi:hypothetical protein
MPKDLKSQVGKVIQWRSEKVLLMRPKKPLRPLWELSAELVESLREAA